MIIYDFLCTQHLRPNYYMCVRNSGVTFRRWIEGFDLLSFALTDFDTPRVGDEFREEWSDDVLEESFGRHRRQVGKEATERDGSCRSRHMQRMRLVRGMRRY